MKNYKRTLLKLPWQRCLPIRVIFLTLIAIVLLAPPSAISQIPDNYREIHDKAIEAGIDPDRMESLMARAQSRQISPEDLDLMVAQAIALAENNLPYQSVLQKTMEGLAKRVPPGSIRQVLDDMGNGLARSADIVDPWLSREEVRAMVAAGSGSRDANVAARDFRNMILENTSYALQQNMREETVSEFLDQVISEKVYEKSGMSPVASAVRALPDLPTTLEDPAASNRLLIRALNAGFTAGEVQQLPDALKSAQFHSQLPAENIARGMQNQMGQGIPAEHILENLFQGDVGGGPPGFTPPGLDRNGDDDDPSGRGRGRRPDTPPGRD